VILPETDTNAAMVAAERLRTAVEANEATLPGGVNIRVTVSIGVALPSSESSSELLSRCDVALYSAKTGGRNRVFLAP
jgi:two-component system cell cycle response regulator